MLPATVAVQGFYLFLQEKVKNQLIFPSCKKVTYNLMDTIHSESPIPVEEHHL
jgi:hypothetical protein